MSLLLFVAGQRATPPPDPVVVPPEVNWPGTTIPVSRFKQMQRDSLAQYLADERARIAAEATQRPNPSARKVKEATDRIVKRIAADGLLTGAQLAEARPIIREMMQGPNIADIEAEFALLVAIMERAAMALDDEAAAFLLLAA